MGLVCTVCKNKGKYRVVIDTGRFVHRLFYCEKHKPISFELQEMNEKQEDNGNVIMFVEDGQSEGGKDV